MDIKIIKNDSDYHEALQVLTEWLRKPFASNTNVENTIELMMLVIKDYENKVLQPIEVDPIDAIKFRMEQMNFKNKDLVDYIGSISKITKVLNKKRKLTLNMIRNLNKGLGIPLRSLIGVNL